MDWKAFVEKEYVQLNRQSGTGSIHVVPRTISHQNATIIYDYLPGKMHDMYTMAWLNIIHYPHLNEIVPIGDPYVEAYLDKYKVDHYAEEEKEEDEEVFSSTEDTENISVHEHEASHGSKEKTSRIKYSHDEMMNYSEHLNPSVRYQGAVVGKLLVEYNKSKRDTAVSVQILKVCHDDDNKLEAIDIRVRLE